MVVTWFVSFVWMCGVFSVVTLYLSRKASSNYNTYIYKIETWHRDFKVYMKPDRWINWTIISIDLINISWSCIGMYINKKYADPKALSRGAIDACSKEHGLLMTFAAFLLLCFGFCQIIRLGLYVAFIVCHRFVFGNWEARARAALNR